MRILRPPPRRLACRRLIRRPFPSEHMCPVPRSHRCRRRNTVKKQSPQTGLQEHSFSNAFSLCVSFPVSVHSSHVMFRIAYFYCLRYEFYSLRAENLDCRKALGVLASSLHKRYPCQPAFLPASPSNWVFSFLSSQTLPLPARLSSCFCLVWVFNCLPSQTLPLLSCFSSCFSRKLGF